jgi:hypothetical protein
VVVAIVEALKSVVCHQQQQQQQRFAEMMGRACTEDRTSGRSLASRKEGYWSTWLVEDPKIEIAGCRCSSKLVVVAAAAAEGKGRIGRDRSREGV